MRAALWFALAVLVSFAYMPLQSWFGWTSSQRWVLWAAYAFCLLMMTRSVRLALAAKAQASGEARK